MSDLLNVKEVARKLAVSRPLIYKMAAEGQIPCVRFKSEGGREMLRFKTEDIQEFVENHYQK